MFFFLTINFWAEVVFFVFFVLTLNFRPELPVFFYPTINNEGGRKKKN